MVRARVGGQGRAYRGCAAPVAAYLFLPPELLPPLPFPPPLDEDLPPPELLPPLPFPPPLDADLPPPSELPAALPTLSDVFFGEAVARAALVLVAAGSGDR